MNIIILSYYMNIITVISISWLLLNTFPTLYAYYNPDLEKNSTENELSSNKEKFENNIRIISSILYIILIIYIFFVVKNSYISLVFSIFILIIPLYAMLYVSKVVFYSILGVRKTYQYSTAHHTSMKYLTSMLLLIFMITKPALMLLINQVFVLQNIFNELLEVLFYLMISTFFIFLIFTISILLIQDIILYIRLKTNNKSLKFGIKRVRYPLRIEKIYEKKESIWKKYSKKEKRYSKIWYSLLYLILDIIDSFRKLSLIIIQQCNSQLKSLLNFFVCIIKKITSFSVDYIIAISARFSVIIATSITYIIYKYNEFITNQGMDIIEFFFTIFLLPIIFNEISRYYNNRKNNTSS